MDEQSGQQGLSETLRARIANLTFLQTAEQPTPRMRQEITVGIEFFSKALQLHNAQLLDPEYLKLLDMVQDRLDRHWAESYGDLESRGRLLTNVAFFQSFLTRALLEDYNGQSYSPSPSSLHRTSLVRYANTRSAASGGGNESPGDDKRPVTSESKEVLANNDNLTEREMNKIHGQDINSTEADIDDASSSGPSVSDDGGSLEGDTILEEYAKDVVEPLEELLLEDHIDSIKKRLLSCEPERRYPGGEIQRLIDQCDWPGLFSAISSDRRLSTDLFSQRPVVPGAFTDHIKGTVWTGMDKLRDKYFTKSKDANKYTVSKYARGLSSKQALASGNINDASHPATTPTLGEDWEGVSWRGAKNLFKTFASGLANGARGSASRAKAHFAFDLDKPNEKDPLLRSEDQLIDFEKSE